MKKILLTLSLLSLYAHAMRPQSNIVSFRTLTNQAMALIPQHAMVVDSRSLDELNALLNECVHNQTLEFVNKLYESEALRPYIIPVKGDLRKQIESYSIGMKPELSLSLLIAMTSKTFYYLVLHHALQEKPRTILYFTIPGSCDFFDEIIKQCAQEYATRIHIIEIDPTQYSILGLSIDRAPTLIFFRDGKEVYRQTDFDTDAVNQKFTETDTQDYKIATFRFIQEHINLSIQKYLLS